MNEIKGALEELSASFQAAGQSVYAAQAQASAPPPAGEAPKAEEGKKEEVADADYEIVDDTKK